jgi:hypothetical protein
MHLRAGARGQWFLREPPLMEISPGLFDSSRRPRVAIFCRARRARRFPAGARHRQSAMSCVGGPPRSCANALAARNQAIAQSLPYPQCCGC